MDRFPPCLVPIWVAAAWLSISVLTTVSLGEIDGVIHSTLFSLLLSLIAASCGEGVMSGHVPTASGPHF